MEQDQWYSVPASLGAGDCSTWYIGSREDCAYQLRAGAEQAAVLQRRENRLFIRCLSPAEPVLVNQVPLACGDELEVTRQDYVEVAGAVVELEPQLFLGGAHLGIDTTALSLRRPDGKPGLLCDGVFLRAEQGSLTAIMGPAGSGKTVFLNLLNGYLRPTPGRVLIGGRYDLHLDGELLKSHIGFVPQDDVMIPELTVRQSLNFRLQLRYPDMTPAIRARVIDITCARLGFTPGRAETFLETMIGSPELGRRGLSGGERRRANIAHELLMKPAVLLLDEPTSGLSSVDAEQVVGLLHTLAREEHLTVVATIHQPSRESFACFDSLMVLGYGGRVVYYGPGSGAVAFFEQATEEPFHPNENPAEYVLRHVHIPCEAERIRRYLAKRSAVLPKPLEAVAAERRPGQPTAPRKSCAGGLQQFGAEFFTLLKRNLTVALADRCNLWLALGQAPLIAGLVWLAFANFSGDAPEQEQFSRSLYHFSRSKEPYLQPGPTRPMPVESLLEQSLQQAREKPWMVSPQMAQRRGAIYFVLVAAAIWLGTVSACREIVVEKHVLRREARACLGVGPYLGAKLATQGVWSLIQCGSLALLVAPGLLGVSLVGLFGVWLALWTTAMAASSLGLLISAAAPTYRAALTAVPLVLIPQLLFGGLLRPHLDSAPASAFSRWAGWLTFQRWGFESVLAMDPYAANGVMLQRFLAESSGATDMFQFLRQLEVRDGSMASVFFGERTAGRRFGWPLILLAAETGGMAILSRRVLIRGLGLAPQADAGGRPPPDAGGAQKEPGSSAQTLAPGAVELTRGR